MFANMQFKNAESQARGQFLVYRHWYLATLLEQNSIAAAINLLQNHLKPLSNEQKELSDLSSLIMFANRSELLANINKILFSESICLKRSSASDAEDLFEESKMQLVHHVWDLLKLNKNVPPPNRLQRIVKQAKSLQILQCAVHAELPQNYSIIEDHSCKISGYPNTLVSTLKQHNDEVWHVQFSPNGLYAVSICKQSKIVLWKVTAKQEKKKIKKLSRKKGDSSASSKNEKEHMEVEEEALMKIVEESEKCGNEDEEIEERQDEEKSSTIKQQVNAQDEQETVPKDSKKEKRNNNNKSKLNVGLEFVSSVDGYSLGDFMDSPTIVSFAWNEHSDKIVTSESNKRIKVWSIQKNGELIVEAVLREGEVEAKSVTFVGDKVMFTAEDEFIYMWEWGKSIGNAGVEGTMMNAGVPKMECEYDNQSIHHCANQPANIVSVSNQGRVSTIHLAKRQEMSFFVETKSILLATLTENSKYMLLNTMDQETPNELHLWNMETSLLENVFNGYKQTECQLRPSFSDPFIAFGDEEGCIWIWHKNLNSKPICQIKVIEKDEVVIQDSESRVESVQIETPIKDSKLSSLAISQVHFNPVIPGLLITACDDMHVRLFASSDCSYQINEITSSIAKQSKQNQNKQQTQQNAQCKKTSRKSSTSKPRNKSTSQSKSDEIHLCELEQEVSKTNEIITSGLVEKQQDGVEDNIQSLQTTEQFKNISDNQSSCILAEKIVFSEQETSEIQTLQLSQTCVEGAEEEQKQNIEVEEQKSNQVHPHESSSSASS